MAVRKDKNSWWVDFRHNDIRYRKRSPENSKTGARAYEVVMRQKLARGEPLVEKIDQDQKFHKFAWMWFETYVKTNNKASEIRRKFYALRGQLVPFFGKMPIDQIKTIHIEKYKAKKIKSGLTNKTVNNHLTVLSSCLRAALEWGQLEKLPKIKKLNARPYDAPFLSSSECEKLLACTTGIWRDIMFAALHTGMRQGELRGLRWADINWSNRTLTVRHSWCDYKKGLNTPKSNRERHIPLTNELHQMLLQKRMLMGFVFPDKRGNRYYDQRLNREISRACTKAHIKQVTCHTLRHTFASHLVMKGAPLKAIQELLGHANIQTTMRYAHLAPSSLKEAITLLEPARKKMPNFGQYMVSRRPYGSDAIYTK